MGSDLEQVAAAIRSGRGQQLIESAQTSRENKLADRLLPRDLIQRVWLTMASLYGHKWTSSYGDTVDEGNVWAACLRGITADQIKHGLNQCVLRALEWPPSAPEFRGLCLDDSEVAWEHRQIERATKEWREERKELLLEDITKREKARVAGATELSKLKSLFNISGE